MVVSGCSATRATARGWLASGRRVSSDAGPSDLCVFTLGDAVESRARDHDECALQSAELIVPPLRNSAAAVRLAGPRTAAMGSAAASSVGDLARVERLRARVHGACLIGGKVLVTRRLP